MDGLFFALLVIALIALIILLFIIIHIYRIPFPTTFPQVRRKKFRDAYSEVSSEQGDDRPKDLPNPQIKEGDAEMRTRQKRNSRAAIIAVLVIVLVLSFTNPSTADFKSSGAWFKGVEILYNDGELTLLEYGIYSVAGFFVSPDRSNYMIFSTYTIDGIKFVGIFNRIYVISDGKLKQVDK